MNRINLKILFPLIFLFLYTSHASAGLLKYIYASNSLDWQYTLIAGSEYHELINEADGEISFDFSVLIDDTLLSSTSLTSLSIKNSVVDPDVIYEGYGSNVFTHFTSGRLNLNPDKTVNSWDLFFTIYVRNTADTHYQTQLKNHRIYLKSSGGGATCDCDVFHEISYILTQRPHNTWIRASSGDSLYTGSSSFENWSIERISVSEPGSVALLIAGLFGLAVIRKRYA